MAGDADHAVGTDGGAGLGIGSVRLADMDAVAAEAGGEVGMLEGIDHLHADVLLHILKAGDIVEFDSWFLFYEPLVG